MKTSVLKEILMWSAVAFGLLIAFYLLVTDARAAGTIARISWTPPTTYIDGRALPAADLKEYVVLWSRSASGPFTSQVVVTAPATTVDVPGMVCGSFHFVVRATVVTNVTSDNSAAVVYATNVSCNTPNPPTAVTVQ